MPSSLTTSGVIQPAQSLSRGKLSRSSTSTSTPARLSFHAAVDPAGPAPTINTSQLRTGAQTRDASGRVQVRARRRDVVVARWREQHPEQLQAAGAEGRHGARQVEPPHAHETLI